MPVRYKFTLRDYIIVFQLLLLILVYKNNQNEAKLDRKIAKAVAKKIEKDFNITENAVQHQVHKKTSENHVIKENSHKNHSKLSENDHIYHLEIPHHSSFNSNFDPDNNSHHKRSNHEKIESVHEICEHVDYKIPVRKYCPTMPTVHVHIPKAAGTSLDHTISHILTEKHIQNKTSSNYRKKCKNKEFFV